MLWVKQGSRREKAKLQYFAHSLSATKGGRELLMHREQEFHLATTTGSVTRGGK